MHACMLQRFGKKCAALCIQETKSHRGRGKIKSRLHVTADDDDVFVLSTAEKKKNPNSSADLFQLKVYIKKSLDSLYQEINFALQSPQLLTHRGIHQQRVTVSFWTSCIARTRYTSPLPRTSTFPPLIHVLPGMPSVSPPLLLRTTGVVRTLRWFIYSNAYFSMLQQYTPSPAMPVGLGDSISFFRVICGFRQQQEP